MMEYGDHQQFITPNAVDQRVGKFPEDGLTAACADFGMAIRMAHRREDGRIERAGEFETKACCPRIVPSSGLEGFSPRFGAEYDAHQWLREKSSART